jgi:taurine dioxygenase
MTFRAIEVIPMPAATGAEVCCAPLQDIDDSAFQEIRRAWLQHQVLLFRNQQLDGMEFLRFSRRFGPLKAAPAGSASPNERTELHLVSNVRENGAPIGILGYDEVAWHSDMAGFLQPPSASLLHALEVPAAGGDTSFANMYLAYDTLPADIQRRAAQLTVKHLLLNDSADAGSGAIHPCVATHAETGCNALFLGERGNTFVIELSWTESREMLHFLWEHATQPGFVWRHRWQSGDVVVWDNRCLLHRREAFDAGARRILYRTQVEGTAPASVAPDVFERLPHPRGHAIDQGSREVAG